MARRIFISFQHDDINQAKGFNLLRWNPNVPVEFVGRHLLSPVNSESEQYIKQRIREQLEGTSVTVVLIGDNTAESDWVDYEIRASIELGKGLLGIRLKGAENADVPPSLEEAEAKTINWNPDVFADELERAALIAGRPNLEPPSQRWAGPGNCLRA